jgi:excinuclease UvrABC nuclease subunit
MGLEWTDRKPLAEENVRGIPAGAGLYLLSDAGSQEVVYIGQSADVANRLAGHSRKTWEGRTLMFSYQIIGQSVVLHNLKELENDLIGNYFENFRKAPEFQFRGST